MWPGRSAVGADALIYMELPPDREEGTKARAIVGRTRPETLLHQFPELRDGVGAPTNMCSPWSSVIALCTIARPPPAHATKHADSSPRSSGLSDK